MPVEQLFQVYCFFAVMLNSVTCDCGNTMGSLTVNSQQVTSLLYVIYKFLSCSEDIYFHPYPEIHHSSIPSNHSIHVRITLHPQSILGTLGVRCNTFEMSNTPSLAILT